MSGRQNKSSEQEKKRRFFKFFKRLDSTRVKMIFLTINFPPHNEIETTREDIIDLQVDCKPLCYEALQVLNFFKKTPFEFE